MPRIPTIDPSGNKLTNESTKQRVDPAVVATKGRMYQTLGEGMEQAATVLEKAHSLAERTKAENIMESKLADIEDRAARDTDFSPETHKKYQDEVAGAMNEAAGHVSIPLERDVFNSAAQTRSNIAKIKINNLFTTKMVDNAKGELETFMATQKKKYITAGTMAEKQTAILERDHKLDEMVKAQFISREEAAVRKVKENEAWNKDHLAYDVDTDPYFALDQLKKGEKGFYRGLDAATRQKFEVKAQKRVDYLDKRHIKETENDLMVAAITKTLTPEMVEEAKLTNSISNDFYRSISKKVSTYEIGPTDKKNGPAYMDLVNILTSPSTDPKDARIALINAEAEGKISAADFKKLYQMHLIPGEGGGQSVADVLGQQVAQNDFEAIVEKDTERDSQVKEKNTFWKGVIDYFQSFTGKNKDKAAELVEKVQDAAEEKKLTPEELQEEAAKIMAAELLKAQPEIKSYPKEGKLKTDAHGNVVRVFPDGSYREEKI